ncbi:radical SAM family heme chaperone HemW [Snuella lapsa]|uniref:Heme chaperone HemW n=1 Tax=Snuella lapsa TaxID=870481 RepID=A0ABP6WPA2_9FLAO
MVKALLAELELRKDEFKGQNVETIYLGGGTPSLLSDDELRSILGAIYKGYNVTEAPEITLEANPDDLTKERLMSLADTGINRLSIGIQSFFEDDLKSMNRAHNALEAQRCLDIAQHYFNNITIDLIYGIPGMDINKWDHNLEIAFKFGVNHISSYALTVEPKTALDTFIRKGTYPPLDESLALQHFNHLMDRTTEQGFVHYEISNFGKPDYFSKHNTSYWQGKPYIGIGPSAHSFNRIQRSWNIANNTKYIQAIQKGVQPVTIEELSIQDRYNEYVMTGLRTIWGISLNTIASDFGEVYKHHVLEAAQTYFNEGLLTLLIDVDNEKNHIEKITTTPKGKFLVDGIASELFMLN